jgi:hypothetical protein
VAEQLAFLPDPCDGLCHCCQAVLGGADDQAIGLCLACLDGNCEACAEFPAPVLMVRTGPAAVTVQPREEYL